MALENKKVGFIGGGQMAVAMLKGLLSSGMVKATNVLVSYPTSEEQIKEFGAGVTMDNSQVFQTCDVIIIAVKPDMVPLVLKEVHSVVTAKNLVVSIAAGITLEGLQKILPNGTRVIRVMPNTPALVNTGASVFTAPPGTSEADMDMVKQLLTSVGTCDFIPEKLINAAAAVNGSGPAFCYLAIEALADGAVKMGVPRDLAIRLAAQTLAGAGKMVLETGEHPGALKDKVSSPGGTTIAGIHELEKSGFRAALINAVQASTIRADEIGRINREYNL